MVYNKLNWQNLPDKSTPLSAGNLNHLETQYEESVAYTNAQIALNPGPPGDPGGPGTPGDPGPAGEILSATAVGQESGTAPTVTLGGTPSARTMQFGIPAGQQGAKGDPGADGTSVNIVGTLPDVGSLPASGEPGDAYMIAGDLWVWSAATSAWENVGPIQGPKGDPGNDGTSATITAATAATTNPGTAATVTLGGTPFARTFAFGIPRGDAGAPGAAGTIISATASSLEPGSAPTVTLGGTPSARTMALGIPSGAKGDQGNPTVVNGKTGASIALEALDVRASPLVDPRFLPSLISGRSVYVFAGSSTTQRGRFIAAFMGHLWRAWRPGITSYLSDAPAMGEGLHLINAGVGNTTSESYLTATTRAQVSALNPSVVFHTVGSNDWYYHRTPTEFAGALRTQIAGISSNVPLLHVLVHQHERADMPARNPSYTWRDYAVAMDSVASEAENRIFVNVSDEMRELGVGEGLSNQYDLLSSDNVHLAVPGEQVMAAALANRMGLMSGMDTGWVNLDSTLNAGFSFAAGGRIVAKRSGNFVTVKADGIQGTFAASSATTNIITGIPEMFRPDVRAWGSAWGDSGSRVGVAVVREAGTIGAVFQTPPGQCQLTISFLV